MNVRHSSAYEKLAVAAAAESGLKPATAEAAAEDASARQLRDGLWLEYERRLRDTQTYRLEDVREWLTEQAVAVSRAAVQRDRAALLARERAISLAAAKARAVLEAAGECGEHDTLRGGRILAGQLLFSALSELSPAALEDLSPTQVLRMIDTLGLLSKTHAEVDLVRQKLAEARRRFDEQVAAAQKQTAAGDGKLAPEQLDAIRRAVFGSAA